jgi:hypothetical protein
MRATWSRYQPDSIVEAVRHAWDAREGCRFEGKSGQVVLDQVRTVDKPIAIAGVNEDFARQVDVFIQQYRPAREELAK